MTARRASAPRRGVVLVDAIVGSILLGMALAAIIGLATRAIGAQIEGQELRTAAMLLDEQLNLVLMRGPDGYAARFDTEGPCDEPYSNFTYTLEITGGEAGNAYDVAATVAWFSAGRLRSESARTLIAPRLGDDPDPIRRPDEAVQRW